ncbi:multidrug effflux MFS transporter [Amaricoccus sp.]|uniref:multidrug effflux MFS transporter n=1 Tax=Amaricoccus sp. TaxID=1872485 RepID=UPI00263382B2|nr:multidrug effflux MFS transporter [Amaricoccus sp.]HRO10962.1 multidrug effflux MFS transporter [Amaricoccus sp.]
MPEAATATPTRLLPHFAEFVTLMAALMGLTALSIDVMLPALPQMREEFALLDANRQQLVITSYLFGFALGQFFHGPLSDRLGRKPVLLAGLAVYALASVACFVAARFEGLLFARALQGLAAAAPRIVAVAVVRDAFGGRRMAEVMSFVMMVFILVPVVAPTIGTAFLAFGSWHLIFAFLGAFAIAVLAWSALRLPETHPAALREPLSLGWVARAFREAATTPQTGGYTLAAGVILGALMAYITSAQQVFVEAYDSGRWFPILFGCVAATLALAAFVNSHFVMRLGMRRVSHAATLAFCAVAILHLGLDLATGRPPLAVFVGLLAAMLFCFGLIMPNFNAIAMEPMGRIAGTASSFFGAVTTFLSAGLGLWIGLRYDGSVTPLLAGFVFCGVGSLAIVLVTEKGRLFRASH